MTDRLLPGSEGGGVGPADERLARLYMEYVDRLIAGDALEPAEVVAEHPELGPELLKRLKAFQDIGSEEEVAVGQELGILGDYRLIRQVGRGGMGIVYEAWQNSLDRRVALKVLPAALAAENKTFLRFMREARTAGRLNHSNIVSVYGIGVEANTPYYSMEFVEGHTLEEVLAVLKESQEANTEEERDRLLASLSDLFGPETAEGDPGATAEEEAAAGRSPSAPSAHGDGYLRYCRNVARAFAGVAEGLQHAHQKGVIHRDIKPSNLILDERGCLRVLDFGLARLVGQESLTLSGDFLGTPLYMSPEQAVVRKAPIDHRTDVYSLGATLYQMLAGRPPFRGRDYQDTLSQIVNLDPPPLTALEPRVPQDLENIVLKCLRKESQNRYGSSEALSQDLRRFLLGNPVEARPQPLWEKFKRRLYRQKVRVLVCLCAVLFLASSGLLLHQYRAERQAASELRYRDLVTEGAMLLEMTGMTAKAAFRKETAIDPQDLFLPGDFLTMAGEDGVNPIEAALKVLDEAKAILPARPEAYYHGARGRAILGRDGEALRELGRALERAPSFVPARILREDLLPAASGVKHPSQERPESWEGLWLAAHLAQERGDWRECAAIHARLMEERFRKQEPYLGALAESSLGRGRALLEEGDASPAIESFVAAGTLWPDAKVPQLLLAKAYYQKGDRENAERVLQALYQRAGTQKDEVVLWVAALYKYFQEFERGLEWSQYAGQEALRLRLQVDFTNLLGRFEEAIRIGREAIRKFPDDGRTHHFLAVALIRDPKLAAEGLEVAKRAWDLSPGCADTLSLLATAYQCTGDSGKAEELFQRAIDLAPREPRGYDHLARLLMKEGRLREAEERFRQAIAVMEKSARFHFLKPHNSLGNVLMAQGKLEECIGAYRNAIEFEPREPIPRGNLGIIFRRLGRFEEAEECLRKAVELAPGDPRLARQLALVHLQKDRPDQAISVLEQALRAAPRYRPAASDLAFILEKEGRPLEAFDRIFQMLKDSGQDRTLHESLVALERRRGRGEVFAEKWDEVAEWLEGTPQFREGKPGILNTLAVALLFGRQKRDPGRARELARAAVEKTDRKLPRFLATLAEAELSLGMAGAAVPLLEEALRLPHPLRAHREMLQECRTLLGQGRGGTFEREGRIEEALGSFREAVRVDRESPERRLRLAESLREAGRAEEAERELRSALETVSPGSQRDLWTLWASVCLSDLGRDPSEILAGFPPARAKEAQADGGGNPEGEDPGGGAPGDPASDLRWLFERLREREPIRIDCGGKGWRNAQDVVWGPDRFFEGGWERARETYDIAGTDDDLVYQTARWFPEEEIAGGYRIPLPRGSYRVTLHFTETALWDRFPRIMDVAIENSQALEAYDPLSRGFATADRRQFEVEVDDGLLEIRFLPRREDAMIAGIEIERIEDR